MSDDKDDKIKALELKLNIAIKALTFYEQAFEDTGVDYDHLVCLQKARETLQRLDAKDRWEK